ncbi:AAA family ATPase [Algisphaera agarilytica]|uniref:MoxR-like ATPase n=1 Tax=Algisphaera agarilytica TaxID=1385975 RepID=A0A7X0H673_9BACT|nr:MoxR family ATPase [Algisphaera agarilytica]MBB6428545.1 MoxR-like ATPase [Algisphaera agarilytica]
MHQLERLRSNIQSCFLGNQQAIDKVIICLLAKGHVLIEDVPGVGKTTLAIALSKSLDGSLSRIQLTPDMLPADILGVTIWDQQKAEFSFKAGPIFSNVVLADEINRTTPRTQSALLEAMNESQVSMDGITRKLLDPFIVIATQNPVEFEGTYFLPESQLDRFLMRISLGYPSPADEARVLTLDPRRTALAELKPVMTAQELVELQKQAEAVSVDSTLVDYVVAIANATRTHDQLQIGVSPRGSLALIRAVKATALVHGRDYATPEDVTSNVNPVFAHRCVTKTYMHEADGVASHRVLKEILETVPSPV